MTQLDVEPQPLGQRLNQLKEPWLQSQYLLISGTLCALVGLVLAQPQGIPNRRLLDPNRFCQEVVQPGAAVSREQLAQLLTVPERGQRPAVRQIVKEPYCRMPSLTIRAGATTERDAYPLAFDSQTWLVILYEGDTYVGYGFKRS